MDDSEKLFLNLTVDLVPFFNIFRGSMEENIKWLARDLEQCCRENPNVEVIQTGSSFERLSLPHLDKREAWNTDADHMIIRTEIKVHEDVNVKEGEGGKSDDVEQGSCGVVLQLGSSSNVAHDEIEDTDTTNLLYIYYASHAGYAHLSHKKLSLPLRSATIREHCLENSKFIESSQNLIRLSKTAIKAAEGGLVSGPAYSIPYTCGSFIVDRDFVYGLKCEFWPSQAKHWINRERKHSWPSTELIESIVAQGCHIVPVGSHVSCLRGYEWRFSFSVAEMMLAESLTEREKLICSVLKALIKSEMKLRSIDVFASYHLKTCLFWFLEKKGIQFCEENMLETTILELLDFLISFYASGCLPNYFISQNNMIDHRTVDDIQKECHVLRDIRSSVTHSLCRYIETNQSLPVTFDSPLTQQLKENSEKFLQNCKYNFLVMALAYVLKHDNVVSGNSDSKNSDVARSLVIKARLLRNSAQDETFRAKLYSKLSDASVDVGESSSKVTAAMVLSVIEDCLAADKMKVTESSAVALAVFNVSLALHPTPLDPGFEANSLELQRHLGNPVFKDILLWAARVHETYSDVIYDFVVKKWVNGPQFYSEDHEAKTFLKLLMIVLGKPTKQSCAVTGSLVRRSMEGQRFLIVRSLANYLLHVNLESAYVAYQAAAYLMATSVLSEIYNLIKWSTHSQSKLRAIELVLSKQELQAEISEKELASLVQSHHELLNGTCGTPHSSGNA